jgi:outer membrane protein, multidrug efflux system
MNWTAALTVFLLLETGCTVGPNYRRPAVETPTIYRGLTAAQAEQNEPASLADQSWWEVFQDEQLQELIGITLRQNYDARIAATRILQAQAQLGITRADQFPTLSAGAAATDFRFPRFNSIQVPETSFYSTTLSLSWELDFWGKFRRATEAARANLLASHWARQAVFTTLVSNVATAYFQLRELDLALEISRRTLAARQDSLQLTQLLADRGSTSMLDVHQAEQLVYTAAEQIPDLERRIEQQENAINILLGKNPGPVPRGRKLTEQPHAPEVPAGLPSSLLARRPDICEAEQQLIAANAEIGVAKAAFFPQISLTGTSGYASGALSGLFSGPAGLWFLVSSLSQPLFTGGKLTSNLRLAEARQQEAVLAYQQTIQQAFQDVSDQLVAYRKTREFRQQQELLTAAAREAAQLSDLRYKGGTASYLEVLTNDTNYFSAELNLAQAQLNEVLALVQLYRALGGGWQQEW